MGKSVSVKETGPCLKKVMLQAGVGCAAAAALLLAMAIAMNERFLPEGREEVYGIFALFIGSALSGIISGKINKSSKAAASLMGGAVMLAIILIFSVALCEGTFPVFKTVVNTVCISAGCICGCLLATGKKRKRKK